MADSKEVATYCTECGKSELDLAFNVIWYQFSVLNLQQLHTFIISLIYTFLYICCKWSLLQCNIQVSVCTYLWSWDSILRRVIRLWAGQSEFNSWQVQEICPLLNNPHWLWFLPSPLFSCLWGFLPYVWGCWGMYPSTHLYLVLRLKMREVRPLLPLYVFSIYTEALLFICIYAF